MEPGDDHAQQHREHDDRRRVVEERLALDKTGQTGSGADVAEHRNDRRRIGGRHHRSQQQADHQRQARDRPKRDADHGCADNCGDDREHENRGGVLEHPPHVGSDRSLEDKQRQKDVNKRLGADWQVGEQPCEVAEAGGEGRVHQDDRHRADRHPDNGEEHHRGDLEPDRHRLGDGDDHEQGRKDGQEQDDIEHRGTVLSGRRLGGQDCARTFRSGRGQTDTSRGPSPVHSRPANLVDPRVSLSCQAGFSARMGKDRRARRRRIKASGPCRRSAHAGSASDGRAAKTGSGRRA